MASQLSPTLCHIPRYTHLIRDTHGVGEVLWLAATLLAEPPSQPALATWKCGFLWANTPQHCCIILHFVKLSYWIPITQFGIPIAGLSCYEVEHSVVFPAQIWSQL